MSTESVGPPEHVKIYLRRDWIWALLMATIAGFISTAIWAHNEIVRLEVLIGLQEARVKFLEDRRAHEETRNDEQGHQIDEMRGRLR